MTTTSTASTIFEREFVTKLALLFFSAVGTVLRLSSRVASARMEFFDAQEEPLSAGAASYIVA